MSDSALLRPHDPYAALRHRDYLLLSLGWFINVIGSRITMTALAWEIFDRTGSKLNLGWLGGIQAIPLLLLTLPAGALADRFDRRRIISITSILAAGCSVGMAVMSYSPHPHYLMIMWGLVLASSTFQVIGRPARSALVPNVVPTSALSNAVTWNSSIFQVASMVGPAVAGVVIARSLGRYHNVRMAYILDALCTVAFAVSVFFVNKHPEHLAAAQAAAQSQPAAGKSRIRDLFAGVRFVLTTRIVLATITLDLFAVLLGGAVYLLPVYAKDILHVGSVGFGWLRAAEAIGALTMAVCIAHLPPFKKAGRAMLIAVAGFGAATIVFGLSRNFWLSFAMLLLVGAFDNVSVVVRHTLVQVLTPDTMRGRVSAVNAVFIGASNELGGLESGLTAQAFGPVASVVSGGIGTILTVVGVAMAWPQVLAFGSLADAKPSNEPEPQGSPVLPIADEKDQSL